MNPVEQFESERKETIEKLKQERYKNAGIDFVRAVADTKYTYNFSWMGRPIIQYPQDVFAIQEIIWSIKPDLIVETGIAHGGSLVFHASMLELIGHGDVLGIDVDIRPHNRAAILSHPMAKRISMIEGSSVDPEIVRQVMSFAAGKEKVLVILDSNHTHDHVMQELEAYQSLVKKGGYLLVLDTTIEDFNEEHLPADRPWGKGNNPKTAVWEFLKKNDRFQIDKNIEAKLLISVAYDGYLECIKD